MSANQASLAGRAQRLTHAITSGERRACARVSFPFKALAYEANQWCIVYGGETTPPPTRRFLSGVERRTSWQHGASPAVHRTELRTLAGARQKIATKWSTTNTVQSSVRCISYAGSPPAPYGREEKRLSAAFRDILYGDLPRSRTKATAAVKYTWPRP